MGEESGRLGVEACRLAVIEPVPYKRIIARLDIKGSNVIKGIQMDGLRVIGPAGEIARRYYHDGVDEIVIIDTVASLYGRDAMVDLIKDITSECFVPITVGGGIRSVEDADALFRAGADKVAINTGAIARPGLISDIAQKYGAQAVVVHVEAKMTPDRGWECYTEAGREPTGIPVDAWMHKAQASGAGEFLITNVDRDGTRRGVDRELLKKCCSIVSVPVVASSGVGSVEDALQILELANVAGLAIGAAFHYNNLTPTAVREGALLRGVPVRADGGIYD